MLSQKSKLTDLSKKQTKSENTEQAMKLLLFDSRNKKANLSAKGTTLGEDFTSEFFFRFFFSNNDSNK